MKLHLCVKARPTYIDEDDIPAGETIEGWMALRSLVPAADVGADPLMRPTDINGYVAAVAIEQGQTLSREQFEPAE